MGCAGCSPRGSLMGSDHTRTNRTPCRRSGLCALARGLCLVGIFDSHVVCLCFDFGDFVSLSSGAFGEVAGFGVVADGFGFGIELELSSAEAVGDVAELAEEGGAVALFDLGVGAVPGFDAVEEVVKVLGEGSSAGMFGDDFAVGFEDLPAAAVATEEHETFGAVDFDARGVLRPVRIFVSIAQFPRGFGHVWGEQRKFEDHGHVVVVPGGDLGVGAFLGVVEEEFSAGG